MTFITLHGFRFIIDTMDWVNADDAERCSDAIEIALKAKTAAEIAELHQLLTAAREDEVAVDHPVLEALDALCGAAAKAILRGYHRPPMSGHNASVAAA